MANRSTTTRCLRVTSSRVRAIGVVTLGPLLLLTGCSTQYPETAAPTSPVPASSQINTAKSNLTFAVQADPHMDERSDAAVYLATISQINQSNSAFLVDLGDDFMIDKLPQKSDSAITARFEMMKSFYDQLSPSIPLYLVMGNHDGEVGWDPLNTHSVRARYFPEQTYDLNYYSFEQADSLMIVLDPFSFTTQKPDDDSWGWTLGKQQYDWLQQQLSTSTATHKFVFIHQLVGGNDQGRGGSEWAQYFEWGGKNLDGTEGFAEHRPGWAMPLEKLFTTYGVDIVFKGHDHFYAHQESNGLTLQTLPQPSHPGVRLNADPVTFGYMTGTILGGSGYLQVTTHPDSTEVTFIGSDGNARDHYTVPLK